MAKINAATMIARNQKITSGRDRCAYEPYVPSMSVRTSQTMRQPDSAEGVLERVEYVVGGFIYA